jgi:hypothetical protein
LAPENEEDLEELRASLEDYGVINSMAFSKRAINGVINLSEHLDCGIDGAISVTITVHGQATLVDAWFWLVECDGSPPRRFPYWGTQHDFNQATSWS